MNKIKCLECGEELESKYRHDFQECHCKNRAFTDGGNDYMRIGAKDFTKILIWNDKEKQFKSIEEKKCLKN